MSGLKAGSKKSNKPVDQLWGFACNREVVSELAASSGVSERMPLVSRLRFGSATLEADSLLSDWAVPSRGGTAVLAAGGDRVGGGCGKAGALLTVPSHGVVLAVGGVGGGRGADGQPAGTSHVTVWVGK